MGSARPLISIIVVNYKTLDMTTECLRAVYADLGSIQHEIWVVDNNSQDGSAKEIGVRFPDVNVIENQRNAGFGAANNLAMRRAAGEFFLLLNSDAFVRPGAIAALIDCAERHPAAAVVGPRLVNEDGTLQVSCYRFPSPLRAWLENLWITTLFSHTSKLGDYRRWSHDSEMAVDSVTGACMLVRRRAFEQTHGFDESFFMYQEETDWQKTMVERGWSVYFTPEATVMHLGGASGKDEAMRINAHFFESLDYYERKHHGLSGLISLRMAMTVGCLMRAGVWGLVTLLVPGRRRTALSKARHHSRLFVRQATHWRTGLRNT